MNRIDDNLIHTGSNEEIVIAFVKYHVEFILVGGLAISWYCQERVADDMDLLVKPTLENSKKISNALSSINLNGFYNDSFSKHGVQAPLKNNFYADIITPSIHGLTYEDIKMNSIEGKLFNIPILIPSIKTLIKLKEMVISLTAEELTKNQSDIRLLRDHLI